MNKNQAINNQNIMLLIAAVAGGLILLTVSNPFVRILTAIWLIFFLPGYLFLKVLWSKSKEPDPLWRLMMTFPTSIALVSALLLLLNYFFTYNYQYLVILLTLMNVGLGSILFWHGHRPSTASYPRSEWSLTLVENVQNYQLNWWHGILALSLLLFCGSILYAILTPRQTTNLTEFYVFTEEGELPFSINVANNSELLLKLGISNHEGRTVDYKVVSVANTPHNEVEMWSTSVTVPDQATVENILDLPLPPKDSQYLQFMLFMDDSSIPYRSLKIILESEEQ